jgi:predicted nucleic acid-binding protein
VNVLLDTCVVSELRRLKGASPVREAVENFPHEALFISVITLGEIAKGVALLAEGRKKREMALWFRELNENFADNVLAIDRDTTHIWGEITARAQTQGIQIPAADGLIAATALRHGLHVMTRNTKHFAATGALVIDPWQQT